MDKLWTQIENNFYLVSVSFMIFWSIFCHGLITLTLLFIAIYLWTRSKSNTRTKNAAPFLVVYCTLYIVIQHVFNFNLSEDEFVPKDLFDIKIGDGIITITWKDLRLTSTSLSMLVYLGSQCLLLIIFWILLRFFMKDYWNKRNQKLVVFVWVGICWSFLGHLASKLPFWMIMLPRVSSFLYISVFEFNLQEKVLHSFRPATLAMFVYNTTRVSSWDWISRPHSGFRFWALRETSSWTLFSTAETALSAWLHSLSIVFPIICILVWLLSVDVVFYVLSSYVFSLFISSSLFLTFALLWSFRWSRLKSNLFGFPAFHSQVFVHSWKLFFK